MVSYTRQLVVNQLHPAITAWRELEHRATAEGLQALKPSDYARVLQSYQGGIFRIREALTHLKGISCSDKIDLLAESLDRKSFIPKTSLTKTNHDYSLVTSLLLALVGMENIQYKSYDELLFRNIKRALDRSGLVPGEDGMDSFWDELTETLIHPEGYDIIHTVGLKDPPAMHDNSRGVVYRHKSRSSSGLDRDLAIKTFNSAPVKTGFWEEVDVGFGVQHPNIVALHDISMMQGMPVLLMEAGDKDLDREVKGISFSWKQTLDLADALLAGLAHFHAKGYIHRDIKPMNVISFINDQGKKTYKLADFGFSTRISELNSHTRDANSCGTPAYSPPEVMEMFDSCILFPDHPEWTQSGDLFSLGATLLYTMVPPHQQENYGFNQAVHSVWNQDFEFPSEMPRPLAGFVNTLLQYSRHHRFPSAVEAYAYFKEMRQRLPAV